MSTGIAVESQCLYCDSAAWPRHGRAVMCLIHGRVHHAAVDASGNLIKGSARMCGNYDDEGRHMAEPFGFYIFSWRPRRCRNGKLRWLRFLERHMDGTYTLGSRAH